MKLYYHDIQNFGDQLNPWLWPKVFDDWAWLKNRLFVGIGTILNTNLPVGIDKVVFGAGAGYKPPPIFGNDHWDIRAVRGPLTTEKLGLPKSLAVTDAAILVSDFASAGNLCKQYKLSVIFHHHSYEYCDWTDYLEANGIHVINPAWSVDEVLQHIHMSQCVATEAMHGAILADTLRVPWFAFSMYPHILEFKWADWCASMDMQYVPTKTKGFFAGDVNYPFGVAKSVLSFPFCKRYVRPVVDKISFELIGANLLRALNSGQPRLSRDSVFEDRRNRMREIAQFLLNGA